MAIHESGEMYLETILILYRTLPSVRAIDVGEYMGYSRPSVSRGLRLLKTQGMITVDSSGTISFTAKGKEAAESVYERHTMLTDWLVSLGVEEGIATKDACRMEHYISSESFEAIKRALEKSK